MIKQKDLILYSGLIILGLAAPFLFSAFKVDINATKLQVKKAVEGYFSVNVEDVNIIKVKGKTKRSRYRIRKKSDWKKAYVRLADGQSIEVTSE